MKTEYEKRLKQKSRAPKLAKASLLFLVLSLLPILAFIPATLGRWFYRHFRREIRKLPGSSIAYYRISIVVGTAQTAIFAVALISWWIKFVILEG